MVAETFPKALALTGLAEGGWSDRPLKDDPGGPTQKGVTLATFRDWRRKRGLSAPTKADLRRITDAQVAAIFKSGYWDAVKGDHLPAGLDYAVFDFAINSGPRRAVCVLQEVVGAEPDGVIGPKTLAELRARMAAWPLPTIIDRYQDARLTFLKGLPNWSANPGWPKRVEKVRREAKAMAAAA